MQILLKCALLGLVLASMTGCRLIYDRIGGPYRGTPDQAFQENGKGLSDGARDLVDSAFRGFENRTLVDHHLHFFGNGAPSRYEYCPELQGARDADPPRLNFREFIEHQVAWQRPLIQGVYLDTIEVTDTNRMDDQYMARLVELVRWHGPPMSVAHPEDALYRTEFYLYALDGAYLPDGTLDPTSFNYISNEYIIRLAEALNRKVQASGGFISNRFVAVGSINPLRAGPNGAALVMRPEQDWRRELDRLSTAGVRYMKWRPPTMKLDPAAVSDAFYQELAARRIGLLVHTGESMGIRVDDQFDAFAGPARLRRAVELGVEVVMLHVGRMGTNPATGQSYVKEFVEELRWAGDHGLRLFGEVSAVPYGDSIPLLPEIVSGHNYPLGTIVNGSDYPAVTPWYLVGKSLKALVRQKFITRENRRHLTEVYQFNPLLFDFVLKRTLRVQGQALPESTFLAVPDRLATHAAAPPKPRE